MQLLAKIMNTWEKEERRGLGVMRGWFGSVKWKEETGGIGQVGDGGFEEDQYTFGLQWTTSWGCSEGSVRGDNLLCEVVVARQVIVDLKRTQNLKQNVSKIKIIHTVQLEKASSRMDQGQGNMD